VVVVVPLVVMVAVALAGTVTDGGLTVHTGVSVVVIVEVTWQLSATEPVNPEFAAASTWIVVEEVPPGAIALGDNGEGCRVNSEVPPWAAARGANASNTINAHRAEIWTCFLAILNVAILNLESNRLKFTMKSL